MYYANEVFELPFQFLYILIIIKKPNIILTPIRCELRSSVNSVCVSVADMYQIQKSLNFYSPEFPHSFVNPCLLLLAPTIQTTTDTKEWRNRMICIFEI